MALMWMPSITAFITQMVAVSAVNRRRLCSIGQPRRWILNLGSLNVVRDMQMDIDAGKALGCKTVLVTNGPWRGNNVIDLSDYIAENLFEAVKWVLGQ